jgi:multidrug efflux pump
VSFSTIGSVLSTALGSTYVNDFPNAGRLQRVVVQAEARPACAGGHPQALRAQQQGPAGAAVGLRLDALGQRPDADHPLQRLPGDEDRRRRRAGLLDRRRDGRDGEAGRQLPPGFGFEWTGQSREEKLSGSQAIYLMAFSMLAVFLCLAALYESWSIPVAVLLVVPLGVLGSLCGVWLRGMPNDVYFKVGLITIIGLSAKNAILIIEFAKDLQAEGKSLLEATLEACHLRFRPIIMTSWPSSWACCRWPSPAVPARPASGRSAPA